MTKSTAGRIICIVALFCVATAVASPAQTFTKLWNFNSADGAGPRFPLVQGADGNFYGTTPDGGANNNANCNNVGCGTVFEITPEGKFKLLYSFCSLTNCTDGATPMAGLVLGTNGNLYGTTQGGGSANFTCLNSIAGSQQCGTVFEITPGGKLTTLYDFCSQTNCSDGLYPEAPLVLGLNGNFYGTTTFGGNNPATNAGTIFEITPEGSFATLYNFCSLAKCADGQNPGAGLALGDSGDFYGTTPTGGTGEAGTVFRITPVGHLTTIHNFCTSNTCLDGEIPEAGVVQGNDGNFYGTTTNAGPHGNGTVFKIGPEGGLTTLHAFCSELNGSGECLDGAVPDAALVQASDGNFYGTTSYGGANYISPACASSSGCGTVFQITPTGTLTTLYNFCSQANCTDGFHPIAGLMQATNGTLYGATEAGGTTAKCDGETGCGTIFSLSAGLSAFVEAVPDAAKAGETVGLLGNNLTAASAVTFNGVPATFTVFSNTLIKAVIPSGATTGTIEVATPSGTLSSNFAFTVEP